MAMSCASAWVQASLQPVMVTLNFRGKFVYSLLPRNNSREIVHHRGGVEKLIGREPGDRTTDHAANIVHAGLQRDEIDGPQPIPDLRNIVDSKPAQLHLLARRDIGEALAKFTADFADGAELHRAS